MSLAPLSSNNVTSNNAAASPQGFAANGFRCEPHSIDAARPLRVVVIGAGLSGIYAGIRIPRALQNVDLQIYEKNADVAGTWWENRYAGCACDIPAHCYCYTFEPSPNWSKFYASSSELFQYWKGVAVKYGVPKYVKLEHAIVGARWDDAAGLWKLKVEDRSGGRGQGQGRRFDDYAHVVVNATGALNNWKWPDTPGLDSFQGHKVHSAIWDDSYDYMDKRVAVIGSGSTSIQIVPALQPIVKHLGSFVRGRTWIGFPFSSDLLAEKMKNGNYAYTEEEKRELADPETHLKYRKLLMDDLNSSHGNLQKGSEGQKIVVKLFGDNMKEKLKKKPEIFEAIQPDFPVGCRRLTPGPGFLEALVEDNVEFVKQEIDKFSPKGIVTKDGKEREYDAIVCATGFDTTYRPRFPIIGRNGTDLADRWADFPHTYLSVAVDGFPNWFFVNGPNSAVGSGDLIIVFEHEIEYIVSVIRKLQMERYKSIEVKPEAVADFYEYSQTYFQQTVYSTKCRTWYKGGKTEGPITALWPGSCLHACKTLHHPRWEDYNYERLPSAGPNRLGWLGNGWTDAELNGGDRRWYLKPNEEAQKSLNSGAMRFSM